MTDRRDDPGFLFRGSTGGWPEGQWVPLGVPDEPAAARPDESLPFTETPGRLFIAPLDSDLPRHHVVSDPPGSGRNPVFVDSWPGSWLPVTPPDGMTDPAECSYAEHVATESLSVRDFLEPVAVAVTARDAVMSFGPWLHDWQARSEWPSSVRLMLGWEAQDRTSRMIVRQGVIDDAGSFRPELSYRPTPPAPRLRWWERLLRPRAVVPRPEPYPLYEVYRVGEKQ